MMCIEADRWISVRVDGERIPPEAASRLPAHLRACPACRSLLAGEARRGAILRAVLDEGGEEESRLVESIIRAAGARPRRASLVLRSFPRALWSLAAVLLVGIALRFVLPGPDRQPATPRPEGFSPSMVEVRTWEPAGAEYRDGEVLERGVLTGKWNYRFPAREPDGPGLYLEGERVDTLYRPVTWSYH